MMAGRRRVALASGNPHKVAEFAQLLEPLGWALVPAPADFEVEEDGESFAANAGKKAMALQAMLRARGGTDSDIWVLADDSGLEVEALGGAPGVRSARYAEPATDGLDQDSANCRALLAALENVPEPERRAAFVCTLALLRAEGGPELFVGRVEGHIGRAPEGRGGFGYDPLFVPEGEPQSFAAADPALKASMSHRARAVLALRAAIQN